MSIPKPKPPPVAFKAMLKATPKGKQRKMTAQLLKMKIRSKAA